MSDKVAERKVSFMKQKFVETQQYTILQKREKTWTILLRRVTKHVMFLRKYWDKQFFVDITF